MKGLLSRLEVTFRRLFLPHSSKAALKLTRHRIGEFKYICSLFTAQCSFAFGSPLPLSRAFLFCFYILASFTLLSLIHSS